MITSVLYVVFLQAYKSSLVIRHSSLVISHSSLFKYFFHRKSTKNKIEDT